MPIDTEIVRVDANNPDADVIARAAEILRSGGLVAFPTETVYGLGANALDPQAVGRIFEAKGRPSNNPLIVHAPDVEAARQLVAAWPEAAERLAARFWPGPLTLVLPRANTIPDIVTAGGPTVAVRVPAHPVALALLRAAEIPLAAPSANRSTQLSPTRAEHVAEGLSGLIPMILDAGPTTGGLESTVISLTTPRPTLLRPGLISPAELRSVVGRLGLREETADTHAPLPSPGLTARHYAPRARLEIAENGGAQRVQDLAQNGVRVGWLTFALPPEARQPTAFAGVVAYVMPLSPLEYAAQLYARLHELDAAGVERIVVAMPPETEAWQAVRDRLHRAATPP
ncbi:MAG TPA: L-threonylcarbamoyladenylate synthase [Chthonomonadaceae bacterium]|nr:L-threonylcarbamoyladenylate synthase [Chthonomonadaceae bacterium]